MRKFILAVGIVSALIAIIALFTKSFIIIFFGPFSLFSLITGVLLLQLDKSKKPAESVVPRKTFFTKTIFLLLVVVAISFFVFFVTLTGSSWKG